MAEVALEAGVTAEDVDELPTASPAPPSLTAEAVDGLAEEEPEEDPEDPEAVEELLPEELPEEEPELVDLHARLARLLSGR